MKLLITVLILILLQINSSFSQEVQTNIDSENKVEFIDQKLENKLGLFTDYNNFQEARLFKISDSLYALEIYYKPEEKLLKARRLIGQSELLILQKKVTDRLSVERPDMVIDQSGRTKLITWSTLLSLGFYGWGVPAILDVNNGKLAFALYLITSGTGFYYPFSATRDRRITDAAATLAIYGGTRGILHGLSFINFLSYDPSFRTSMVSMMTFSLAEGLIGLNYAHNSNLNSGTSEVISVGGDFGIGMGAGMSGLLDFSDQGVAGSILISSGLGLYAGKILADGQYYTRGDAYVLSGTGILGAYVPLALIDMIGTDNNKAYIASSIIGALGGLWLGNDLVKGKDFTSGQGNLIRLGELTGGLLGAGIAYLVTPEDKINSTIFLTSSSFGAIGGFWFMYNSHVSGAIKRNENTSLNININPLGLSPIYSKKKFNSTYDRVPSIITIDYKF